MEALMVELELVAKVVVVVEELLEVLLQRVLLWFSLILISFQMKQLLLI